ISGAFWHLGTSANYYQPSELHITAREDEEDEEDDTEWEMDALYSARVVEKAEGEEELD
ncbi:MAG: hypothetical protein M1813_008872, partial [Trichoglossum hirsutum]